jgi:hypothetical protein
MAERRFRLQKVPSVSDAIELFGFLCPILKMLPFDVYLRVDVEDTGLILETERHYFDDLYNLSPKTKPGIVTDIDSEYVASLTGSRGYPIDSGSLHKSRDQLQDADMLRKRAVNAFMSRYAKGAILKSAFDSDVKWEADDSGGASLVLTSNSEGDFRRLEKRIASQFVLVDDR